MLKSWVWVAVIAVYVVVPGGLVWAQDAVPSPVLYQGQLKQISGMPAADGVYEVAFAIHDADTSGNTIWTETRSVQVTGGLFTVLLGLPPGVPIEPSVFPADAARWLGVKVGQNPEMLPRQRLGSVPYALRAQTVTPNAIGATELRSDAAAVGKLSGGALTVSGSNVAVAGTLSGSGAGLTGLNAANVTTGTLPIARIADGAVTGAKIADGTIVNADISSGAAIAWSKLSKSGAVPGDVGAAAASHNHDSTYLKLSGGTMTGDLTVRDVTLTGGDLKIQPQSTSVEGGEIELKGVDGRPSYFLDVYTTGPGDSDHKFRIHSQGRTLLDVDYGGVNVRADYGLWVEKDLHVFGRAYHSGGCGDIAENVAVNPDHKDLEPGTVVCIDPEHPDQFTPCGRSYDTSVAGIVSADPNSLLEPTVMDADGRRRGLSSIRPTIPLALVGRVDCFVDTTDREIRIGDLLTTSDTPGHAMKAEPEMINGKPFIPSGTVIGKALEPLPKGRKGKVKVLVTLR